MALDCLPNSYVKGELLGKLNSRLESFEKLFERFPDMATKGNRARFAALAETYKAIADVPLCGEDSGQDGTALSQTDEERQTLERRVGTIDEDVEKIKKKRKRTPRNNWIGHCMRSPDKGGLALDMKTCSDQWKTMSAGDKSAYDEPDKPKEATTDDQ